MIVGTQEQLNQELYSKIFRYRRQVFVETLGWALKTRNGAELDQFDRPDTLYVVAQDDERDVLGCARLLPTTSPYLLGEVFPKLLNGLPPPCSPDVWELSRFAAVDLNEKSNEKSNRSLSQSQFPSDITVELLRQSAYSAAMQGAKRLITVSPIGIERLLRKTGFQSHRAGPPMLVDGHPIFACWIEIASIGEEIAKNAREI